jgi:heme/copper-type cytochrome/quinol oxidase subunit 3
MNARPAIDVSSLPDSELDHRSLVWWGNVLLIAIETTMFALLVAGYFYVRPNFLEWPPPRVSGPEALFDPVPALRLPTMNLLLLLLTLVPMIAADRACLRRDERTVKRMLAAFLALALACIALRFREFGALHFRWDDNAYGSIVWTTVGMHLLHLIVGVLEFLLMLVWLVARGLDDKHARDVRVTAVYWYWIVGTWVILYTILIPGPRFF